MMYFRSIWEGPDLKPAITVSNGDLFKEEYELENKHHWIFPFFYPVTPNFWNNWEHLWLLAKSDK